MHKYVDSELVVAGNFYWVVTVVDELDEVVNSSKSTTQVDDAAK